MDVHEIRRINDLSKELQKHGLARDAADGSMQARSCVAPEEYSMPSPKIKEENNISVDTSSSSFSSLSSLSSSSSSNNATSPVSIDPNASHESKMHHFDSLLERFQKNIYTEMNSLREQMKKLSSQVETMKGNPNSGFSSSSPQSFPSQSSCDLAPDNSGCSISAPVNNDKLDSNNKLDRPPPLSTQQQQMLKRPEVKEDHPRMGSYTSADVSVDKFFYYGKSKK
jgi:hypothetical protein